jgi:NAD(P)-dependent dehydrogenase (short-subunit alcohol dehydrogenase family)
MTYENPFQLTGRKIVITGASSGIGQACAIRCSQQGASVILVGRNQARLEETVNAMADASRHTIINCDITDEAAIEALIKDKIEGKVKIDGVVHCAGISTTLPLRSISLEKLNSFFATNVFAAISLTRIFTRPSMINERASIVFLTSVMAVTGESGKTIYGATKGALLSATRSLAIELATKNIRVNSISPGVVKTPMANNAIYSQDEASFSKIKEMHPLGIGDVSDVANGCIFLLSDAAKWITGSNLIIDGGYTAR